MYCFRQVLQTKDLIVYRPEDSADRQMLMGIRTCKYSYAELKDKLDAYVFSVDSITQQISYTLKL